MISILFIASAAFVSTNIDDIFLLVGLFSDTSYKPFQVILGQYIGISVLVLVSALCAFISFSIVPAYIGLLGFLPILIGLRKLWEVFYAKDKQEKLSAGIRSGKVLSISAITIANGGDNIGIYTPLFVVLSLSQLILTLGVFALMTGIWCLAGYWFVHHHTFGKHVQNWGSRILPFVLILLGGYILWQGGSTELLFSR